MEALAAELWPSLVTIVVSVPDARKGEKFVLLTTDKTVARDAFQRHVKAKGMSELDVPAEILLVDHIPLLGSGKADYVSATKLLKETLATRPARPMALVEEPRRRVNPRRPLQSGFHRPARVCLPGHRMAGRFRSRIKQMIIPLLRTFPCTGATPVHPTSNAPELLFTFASFHCLRITNSRRGAEALRG